MTEYGEIFPEIVAAPAPVPLPTPAPVPADDDDAFGEVFP